MFGTSAHAYLRSVLAGIALCAVALGGCVEERAFYIVQNQVATYSEDGCGGATEESQYRPQGLLDVSERQGYWMYPLLRLDLESSAAAVEGPERNQFVLRSYRVSLDLSEIPGSFSAELTSFDQITSGLLKPGSSLAGIVKVIPDALAQQIEPPPDVRPLVTVELQAVAVRLGTDSELESSTFRYPIEICNGCLVTSLETCSADAEGVETIEFRTNACGLPQDAPVTCCRDTGKCLDSGDE